MKKAPIPSNESARMQALISLGMLDTKPEPRFDNLTKEAMTYFHVPMSMITLVDSNREWFKSCQGTDVCELPRESSFCGHAMLASNIFIIEDTHKDERFKDNPQVTGDPFIRFYAGIALHENKTNLPIGVFCIKDTKPRKLSMAEINKLLELGQRAEMEINAKPE